MTSFDAVFFVAGYGRRAALRYAHTKKEPAFFADSLEEKGCLFMAYYLPK